MARVTRRTFVGAAAALAVLPGSWAARAEGAVLVNDVHARLNPTRLRRVETPDSLARLEAALAAARREGHAVSVAGGRHAMGGQQFVSGGVMIDMRGLDRVLGFDRDAGLLEVEAGIQWPALIGQLVAAQEGERRQWGIAQKQTGADRLTIGGALAANAHGRGLAMKPFVADIESFTLLGADGTLRTCSRTENAELFRLAIGGYGLFGIVHSVRIRLAPRRKLERVVEVAAIDELMALFERRIADGFLYGDFQYDIDERSDGFLSRGVLSCYRPVDPATPIPQGQTELTPEDWTDLILLAHADKARAFERYVGHYLATSGQIYWSDTHQLSFYLDDYHVALDQRLGAAHPATEAITEIYVPRPRLAAFMREAIGDFRHDGTQVVYGTVRLIERDDESFLAWATEPYACIIFNLHVAHTPGGQERAAAAFRRLIDRAIGHGGSFYLTYHRHATRAAIEACYPQMPRFLRLKRAHDPDEVFQSDWYRHYRAMFADRL
ncbi:MAG TPA: FAD-binding oxidoreductase [Thermohalobaculum sp.]|nr:FAD-binding oxidoreductase [Thermohalobaculum sp.]